MPRIYNWVRAETTIEYLWIVEDDILPPVDTCERLSTSALLPSTPPSQPRIPRLAFGFEKLLVYQKAVDFADQICEPTAQCPRGYGFRVDQWNRAALSISAHIAERNGRFTRPDRRDFFGMARGWIPECETSVGPCPAT